ncbi:MAG: tRNA (adenosine(37)-N6)-threonylcarbamoyltransferase complex transferase subunit TsaD [Gemmatimonadaceae bacterium]
MVILGIETSCDETSAAVLEGAGEAVAQRSLVILSQDVHRVFGGVVPEIASRAHLAVIAPVVQRAIHDAEVSLDAIEAVAVTYAPGLVGALLVGLSYGKALSFSRDVPFIGVHHMEAHLFGTVLEHPEAIPPFTALLISGGHTLLIDVEHWGRYRLLGATRDDAAGEAFDKVAKLLGLPYPGGPHIERIARDGDPTRYRFTPPMIRGTHSSDPDYFDLSFSGLKTAVLRATRGVDLDSERPHLSRAFQDSLIAALVEKTLRAVRLYARERVVLGGGVACNRTLQEAMARTLAAAGAKLYAPSPRLATDNAAMIARAGLYHLEKGERSSLDLNAYATLPIPGLLAS